MASDGPDRPDHQPPGDRAETDGSYGDGEFPPPILDDVAYGATGSSTDAVEHDSTLVGVSFDRPVRAQEFLLAMNRLREDGALDLKDAVIVVKDRQGKVRVTETVDPTPGRAALSGAVWTGLFGLLLGGPVGWLAGLGVGAGAGAVAAKVVDLGIPDEWVAWFKVAVSPGTATVVVLVEELDVRALTREAERFAGAELVYTTLPPGVFALLAEAFEGGTTTT